LSIEHYDYFEIDQEGKQRTRGELEGRVIFRVSIIADNLKIKLFLWFENISMVRDLPTDCREKSTLQGAASSALSGPGNLLPADKGS
jgi:hypothetical protein